MDKRPTRLEAKAAGLAEDLASLARPVSRVSSLRGLTGPGQSLLVQDAEERANAKVAQLESRLTEMQNSPAILKIDPKQIAHSRFANRHPDSFADAEFQALKDDIAVHGGNVQPIKLRRLAKETEGITYEIVYGHRRCRACADLGLPVAAIVEQLDDAALFVQMELENRSQKRLSAWEQGRMYSRALDEGLFPSIRQLAKAIGVDFSNLSKVLNLSRLPIEVVDAFRSPNDLQFKWAGPLGDAVQKDPEAVISRARAIRSEGQERDAATVYARLLGSASATGGSTAAKVKVDFGGGAFGRLSVAADGSAQLAIPAGVVGKDGGVKFAAFLRGFRA